jgi:hypothetical protein
MCNYRDYHKQQYKFSLKNTQFKLSDCNRAFMQSSHIQFPSNSKTLNIGHCL